MPDLTQEEVERRLALDPEGFIPPMEAGERIALQTAQSLYDRAEAAEKELQRQTKRADTFEQATAPGTTRCSRSAEQPGTTMSRTPATDADVAEIRSELYGIVEFTDRDIEGLVLRIDADTRRLRALERIVADTLWMARRYADGRQSYATGMYNDAARWLSPRRARHPARRYVVG
jgi:hypothetical protein